MRRLILLMAAMGATVLVVSGVAYALSVQCDGAGDQNPAPGQCQGTTQYDRITGSQEIDWIFTLGGLDVVTARRGDDFVDGGRGRDDISGGVGGDGLLGRNGNDDIDGGPGTTDAIDPPNWFDCSTVQGGGAFIQGTQVLDGGDGNDDLDGGRDNDLLDGRPDRRTPVGEDFERNDLSGNGGDDCFVFSDLANERASGGDGDDLFIFADDANLTADDIFCGAGHDIVDAADAADRVAADCEVVLRPPPLQTTGSTPVGEVTITTPEGTTTMTP